MKSEKEIRKHMNAIRKCMALPCGCTGTVHEAECIIGLRMMKATSETLAWLLNENPGMDRLVERMEYAR